VLLFLDAQGQGIAASQSYLRRRDAGELEQILRKILSANDRSEQAEILVQAIETAPQQWADDAAYFLSDRMEFLSLMDSSQIERLEKAAARFENKADIAMVLARLRSPLAAKLSFDDTALKAMTVAIEAPKVTMLVEPLP
jgi:hypothetical protein